MTNDEHDILREHGELLSSINTDLQLLRKELNGKIPKLETKVETHSEQISYWRGAIALLAFLFLIAGAVGAWHIFSGERTPAAPYVQR